VVRYYVLYVSDYPDISPYIIAEVVRDPLDSGKDRDTSLAGGLVGDPARIVTQRELLQTPEGTLALTAWDRGNDTSFDRENGRIRHAVDAELAVRHLRVVGPDERPAVADELSPPITTEEWRQQVLLRAFGLREISKKLQQEVQERRNAIAKDAGRLEQGTVGKRREHAR